MRYHFALYSLLLAVFFGCSKNPADRGQESTQIFFKRSFLQERSVLVHPDSFTVRLDEVLEAEDGGALPRELELSSSNDSVFSVRKDRDGFFFKTKRNGVASLRFEGARGVGGSTKIEVVKRFNSTDPDLQHDLWMHIYRPDTTFFYGKVYVHQNKNYLAFLDSNKIFLGSGTIAPNDSIDLLLNLGNTKIEAKMKITEFYFAWGLNEQLRINGTVKNGSHIVIYRKR